MSIYDVAIVGTSPVSLFEGLVRSKEGKKVIIIDKNPDVGGAWITEDCMGLEKIETSPHIFMPDQTAYDIIEKLVETKMELWETEPVKMVRGSKLFGDFKALTRQRIRESIFLTFLNKYEKGSGNKFTKFCKFIDYTIYLVKYRYKHKQLIKVKYPVGGLNQWFAIIKSILKKNNAELVLNTRVNEVSCEGQVISLKCDNNVLIKTKKLCINRMFVIDRLSVEGEDVPFSYLINSSQHVTFIVKVDKEDYRNYGFMELVNDPYFFLLSDVSNYCQNLEEKYPGCRVITTRMYAYKYFSKNMLNFYFDYLKELGYLPDSAELINYHYKHFCEKQLTGTMKSRLKHLLGKKIYVLEANDLGLINAIKKYYKKVLKEK